MIPIPTALKKRPTFGNMTPIYIANIFNDVTKEEYAAEKRVNNCQATFFLRKKKVFEILVSNIKTAQGIAIRMLRYGEKEWQHDYVEYKTARREDIICPQN